MTPVMAQSQTGNPPVPPANTAPATASNDDATVAWNANSDNNIVSPGTNNTTTTFAPPSITIATPPISEAARQRRSLQAKMESSTSSHSRPRRRSSTFSYSSLEDATTSFAEDFISPRTFNASKRLTDVEDVTNGHSTPLAFAILPAIGGLLFQNGSLFVTDILLLVLAAIFLNWSIRLPWDWYYSAHALVRALPDPADITPVKDVIAEEVEDDVAVETASSVGGSPPRHARRVDRDETEEADAITKARREKATESLRQQEIFALVATFVFPALAAYLLHVIRAQLSRPSTNLVSDYNLSIFLLAAEIRPCRHVIRLMASRTLYLQKIVAGDLPSLLSSKENEEFQANILTRLKELEDRLEANTLVPSTVSIAQKADVNDLSSDLRKRYEPRLEGLERAVRRYEKRSMTLAMAVDNRLQLLETRLQEALSLTAAIASQNSQQSGSVIGRIGTSVGHVALAPAKLAIWGAALPFQVMDDLYVRFKNVMLGPVPAKSAANGYPKKRSSALAEKEKSAGANGSGLREKVLTRKAVR
jgi:predicted component of type VI protein secretion system